MSKEHRRSSERVNTNKESRKPYMRNTLVAALTGAALSTGVYAINQIGEASATPQPEVAEEVYGISPETQEQLMQIQKQWDHDTAPMAPHEIPESVFKQSGFHNFTIVEGKGGASDQAKDAYADIYKVPVSTLNPEIKDSIDITANSYPRVHGGDEFGIVEVTDTHTNKKYVVVTDEIRLDTN